MRMKAFSLLLRIGEYYALSKEMTLSSFLNAVQTIQCPPSGCSKTSPVLQR